jgi:hypothetical protein
VGKSNTAWFVGGRDRSSIWNHGGCQRGKERATFEFNLHLSPCVVFPSRGVFLFGSLGRVRTWTCLYAGYVRKKAIEASVSPKSLMAHQHGRNFYRSWGGCITLTRIRIVLSQINSLFGTRAGRFPCGRSVINLGTKSNPYRYVYLLIAPRRRARVPRILPWRLVGCSLHQACLVAWKLRRMNSAGARNTFSRGLRGQRAPLSRMGLALLLRKYSGSHCCLTTREGGIEKSGSNAPIGMPHPARRYSCIETSPGVG